LKALKKWAGEFAKDSVHNLAWGRVLDHCG
jgi:hypothetical protein